MYLVCHVQIKNKISPRFIKNINYMKLLLLLQKTPKNFSEISWKFYKIWTENLKEIVKSIFRILQNFSNISWNFSDISSEFLQNCYKIFLKFLSRAIQISFKLIIFCKTLFKKFSTYQSFFKIFKRIFLKLLALNFPAIYSIFLRNFSSELGSS